MISQTLHFRKFHSFILGLNSLTEISNISITTGKYLWHHKLVHCIRISSSKLSKMAVYYFSIRYWRYRGKRKVEGPTALSRYIKNHRKLRLTKIDAVMVWKGGVVDLVYFFTGNNFWRYDSKNRKIVKTKRYSPYPKTSSRYWHKIPFPVDSILTWKNDETYFFKNGNSHRYRQNKSTRRYSGKVQRNHFIKSCRG